ncbi:MAG: PilX N-terminal domain-containing pilus assembly protein [Patescibacteria group bacterium]
MKKRNIKRNSELGFVSIIVTLLLMLIISLIVLAFAKISRREQRQALDRQLSTQAFYAAETGINDAIKHIKANPLYAGDSDCSDTQSNTFGNPDLGNNSAYTCVLVNPYPNDVLIDTVSTTTSQVFPLQTKTGTAISSLDISWGVTGDPSGITVADLLACPTVGSFPAATSATWTCPVGILRVDLVPIIAPINRSNLEAAAATFFLHPGDAVTGSVSIVGANGFGGQGVIAEAKCAPNTDKKKICKVQITGLTNSYYYMRVKAIYVNTSFLIEPLDGSGDALALTNAQAIIDSTGRAADVVRRVQERVKLTPSGFTPEGPADSSNSICKRFTAAPGVDASVDSLFTSEPNCLLD